MPSTDRRNLAGIERVTTKTSQFLRACVQSGSAFLQRLTLFFASVSGLWGVLVTDTLQFMITMSGTFAVAYFARPQPEGGGLTGVFARVDPKSLNLLPDFGDWSVALAALIIPIMIEWWSAWYPGAKPGGGSDIAQRMLASRSDQDAVTGTLPFNVTHYALRPRPWIIVALASPPTYPQRSNIGRRGCSRTDVPSLREALSEAWPPAGRGRGRNRRWFGRAEGLPRIPHVMASARPTLPDT